MINTSVEEVIVSHVIIMLLSQRGAQCNSMKYSANRNILTAVRAIIRKSVFTIEELKDNPVISPNMAEIRETNRFISGCRGTH